MSKYLFETYFQFFWVYAQSGIVELGTRFSPYFMNEDTEAQGTPEMCPRSHEQKAAEQGLTLDSSLGPLPPQSEDQPYLRD